MAEKNMIDLIAEKIPSRTLEGVLVSLEKERILRVGEISDLGKVVLAGLMKKVSHKKILLITSRPQDSIVYSREWGIESCDFLEGGCDIFQKEESIAILSFEDSFQRVVSPEEYKNNFLSLSVGGSKDLVFLSDHLIKIGYERVKKPSDSGEFTIKGDSLEIFVGEHRYRIEFFGNQVERVVRFDKTKKNQGEAIKSMDIVPNNIPEGSDFLIRHFGGYLIVIDGEDALRSHIFSIFQQDSDQISQEEIAQMKKIEDFIKKQAVLYFESLAVSEKEGINLRWFSPKKYHGNTTEFLHDLKSSKKENVVVSEKAKNITKFLDENGIKGVMVEDRKISEGISLGENGPVVFSDKEIFGEPKKKKRRKVDFSALTNLKKGEYVVHIDHGVGVFTGFGEIVVDGVKREYIFIEYSGGDSIYVPLDQADKITKYIAVTNSPPHLSSLKTGQWLKVRKKVSGDVERIARELLEAQALRAGEKGFYYSDDKKEQEILRKTFSYQETPDQEKAIEDVLSDMTRRSPMDRIVCGDVGYGKTEVAIRAATKAVVSGGQVAVLVPTTILAEQHLQTFRERLEQFGFKIESLSRFKTVKEQDVVREKMRNGGVDIVIGTHGLLAKGIEFKNLFLVVIDEEQKFGVKHKEQLKKLRSGCDILTMTATPIPRTLYLGLGGLKDISIISTPPEGRLPIKTIVIKDDDEIVKDAISKEIARGGQVYFVHNRVETIGAMEAKLKKFFPKLRFVVGHGQMPEEKLAHIMNDFAAGKYDVLICSTIIESGLDISTVNTLIVDKATNFGLSQLHQLRGRIGRGSVQAYAYFLYNSDDLKGNAKKRLSAISEKEDLGSGYELSLEDLDIRGSGNILGEDQHGSMQMVGVGYYLKLLEEAVSRLSGDSETSHVSDIKIDLPISAYIPDGFYEKEEDKIKAYQTLAGVDDMGDMEEIEKDLDSKHGDIPVEYKNLLEIVKMKILANKIGISSIMAKDILGMGDKKTKKIFINFEHVLSKEDVSKIFSMNHKWYFGNMLAKIDLSDLGEDWFGILARLLHSLVK